MPEVGLPLEMALTGSVYLWYGSFSINNSSFQLGKEMCQCNKDWPGVKEIAIYYPFFENK